MKDRLLKFLKIYLAFILFALLVNLSMEILIPTPEEKQVLGIVMFYMLFSITGSLVFLFKGYRPLKMGLLSFVLGFFFEFAFMRPDWVLKIYSLEVGGDVFGAVIVSAVYWFIAWGIPSYFLHRYVFRSGSVVV